MTTVPILPSWIGRTAAGEHSSTVEMRQQMIEAQLRVLARLEPTAIGLRVYWLITVGEGCWDWNAQYPIPDGATELTFVGVAEERAVEAAA